MLAVMGCDAGKIQTVVLPSGEAALDDMLAQRPLAEGAPLRADLVFQDSERSIHLVQVRTRENAHIHPTSDLEGVILRGRGTLAIDNRRFGLASGDTALIPRGSVHFFTNIGSAPAVILATFRPPLNTQTGSIPVPEP